MDEVRGDAGNAKLGIHHWADKFVGRGVLIDAFGFLKQARPRGGDYWRKMYTRSKNSRAPCRLRGTTLKPTSILLVRTGWVESYETLSADEKAAFAPMDKLSAMGIEASREMAAWLWNNRVAAVGTDCPAVEAFSVQFHG